MSKWLGQKHIRGGKVHFFSLKSVSGHFRIISCYFVIFIDISNFTISSLMMIHLSNIYRVYLLYICLEPLLEVSFQWLNVIYFIYEGVWVSTFCHRKIKHIFTIFKITLDEKKYMIVFKKNVLRSVFFFVWVGESIMMFTYWIKSISRNKIYIIQSYIITYCGN